MWYFDNSFISLTLTCHFLHDKGLLLGWHCLIGLATKKLAEPFHQQHLSGTRISLQGSLPTSLVADNKWTSLSAYTLFHLFCRFQMDNQVFFLMSFTWKRTKVSFQPELERKKICCDRYTQCIVFMYACVCIWWKKSTNQFSAFLSLHFHMHI